MVLELKTDGWHGGNAVWTTYECTECDNEVHGTTREPDPSYCPYCGCPAEQSGPPRKPIREWVRVTFEPANDELESLVDDVIAAIENHEKEQRP